MPVLPSVGDHVGRYRIERQLGIGGMGVVYAATDLELGRTVALKVISAALGEQEFVERFQREAEVLARLNSPHVIAIYDVGEHDGIPYIVTQFISGGDLGDLIKARGPMPPHLAAQVCAQTAEALSDAHRVGVIHRDIKPSNVLLRNPDDLREPMVYLCDFGIAHTEQDGITQAGTVSGTWSYMSPECGRGEPASVASDVYALGCLLWAALAGRAPYAGTDVEIAIAHQTAPVPQLPGTDDLSTAVNQILLRSMAKEPWARYDDMDRMRDDLMALRALPVPDGPLLPPGYAEATATGQGAAAAYATSTSVRGTATTGRRSRAGLIAGIAVGALVLVGGGAALAVTRPWAGGEPGDDPSGGRPTVAGPVLGDVDSDGFGDVLAYPEAQNEFDKTQTIAVTTFLSDGEKLTPSTETVTGDASMVQHRFSGDFDGDGVGEGALLSQEKSGEDIVLSADLSGGGKLSTVVEPPKVKGTYYNVEPGDLDGDGVDDLFWVFADTKDNLWTGTVNVQAQLLKDGKVEAAKQLLTQPGDETDHVSLGDVNGDDKADLVVTGQLENADEGVFEGHVQVATWIGDGTGAFEQVPQTTSVFHGTFQHVNLADMDGDGRDEYYFVQYASQNDEVRVGEFDDDNVLQKPRALGVFTSPDNYDDRFLIRDVNGDGRADVVHFYKPEKNQAYRLDVALSDGEHYSSAAEWAVWEDGPTNVFPYQLMGEELM